MTSCDNAQFTNLGDGIIHIDAEYMKPDLASVYLIIEGEECAIVETGNFQSVRVIHQVLEAHQLSPEQVRYVIPTHVHLDHAGGVGLLMQQCANAQLVVHPKGARHMTDPARLQAGASAVYGKDAFKKLYGELIPVEASRVISPQDDERINWGSRILHFYDTPGHARHHFCIHDSISNTIFTGDTFGLSYPALMIDTEKPFVAASTSPVQFDPEAMRGSISRLAGSGAAAFNLTHFGRIANTPDNAALLERTLDIYLGIAEQHKTADENRSGLLEQGMTEALLALYRECGGTQSESVFSQTMAMDIRLNAQGLDIWLDQ